MAIEICHDGRNEKERLEMLGLIEIPKLLYTGITYNYVLRQLQENDGNFNHNKGGTRVVTLAYDVEIAIGFAVKRARQWSDEPAIIVVKTEYLSHRPRVHTTGFLVDTLDKGSFMYFKLNRASAVS